MNALLATAYDDLVAQLKRAHLLGAVSGILSWDEQVNLPPGGAAQRGEQLGLLAELQHAASSHPAIGERLAELEQRKDLLSPDQRVVVREARRDYDRITKLPPEFVAERARLNSAAYHAWVKARPANDFAGYAPFLERQLEMAKREAEHAGWGERPYDYAIDQHDPGFTLASVEALLAELKTGLVPLVRRIAAAGEGSRLRLRGFPVERQRLFLREVTERIGFDYRRGRIDVSVHPFCGGSAGDVRMTTRYAEDEPLSSLFGSIHETGHGLYEQGLPVADLGTPLGEPAGMAVHESQSRLWENQVGRGRAFWRCFEARYRELFSEQLAAVDGDAFHRAVNEVRPTFVRVEADELHYNLHIILRFELEKRLFAGTLAVRDLPAAWNALSIDLFGAAPPDDRDGVLQDVHWSGGAFGYFPSYALGNMIAAQLWRAIRREMPDLEKDFARGDFSRLLGWLRDGIHRQGRRYPGLELVQRVTGEPLSARPLLAYLKERYGSLHRSFEEENE